MAKTKIKIKKNGPLIVQGCTWLEQTADGTKYETRETFSLCRCGGSAKKPFCDGTHAKNGFTDEKEADRVPDQLDSYAGRELEILDNRGICAHAGYCTDGLPQVWRMKIEPWIDPNGALRDEIIATIKKCPSGALAWAEKGVVHTEWHGEERILVNPGGPFAIQGGADLEGAEFGEGASREHFALCRCGKSKNKPFCSGAHWYHHFDDERKAAEGPDKWHDVGAVEELAQQPLREVTVAAVKVALANLDGKFCAISGTCAHAGGPLGQGKLENGVITCPWHGWSFDARTGKDTGGKGAVGVHPVEIREGRVFVNSKAVGGGKRKLHRLERPIKREEGPLRIVGISTTNMNLEQPRYSTSEVLLETALEHAQESGAETKLVKLRELGFRNCEGYYSKSAESCTWPCTITQLDPKDQMEKVRHDYERQLDARYAAARGFGFFGSGDGLTDDALGIDGRTAPAGPSPNRRSTFIVETA